MNDRPPFVVLADDDEDDISIFRECFEEVCSDKKLLIAHDGQKLMHLLDSGIKPGIIYLDLNMPKMNGKQCLVEIRKRPIFNQTKIIILSTSSWETDIEYCLSNGANEYLVKPNSIEKLKSYIKSTCGDLTPML